jgi:hypothetical protein
MLLLVLEMEELGLRLVPVQHLEFDDEQPSLPPKILTVGGSLNRGVSCSGQGSNSGDTCISRLVPGAAVAMATALAIANPR